jgi:ABC-type transporter Mla MlaB component
VREGVFGEGPAVLRITWIDLEGSTSNRTLKLEGKLLGPWVDELSRACEELRMSPHYLRIDLSDVTFVDPIGVTLLCDLLGQGATIVGCSGFIADLLTAGGGEPGSRRLKQRDGTQTFRAPGLR